MKADGTNTSLNIYTTSVSNIVSNARAESQPSHPIYIQQPSLSMKLFKKYIFHTYSRNGSEKLTSVLVFVYILRGFYILYKQNKLAG
jgi:hypothetical protein